MKWQGIILGICLSSLNLSALAADQVIREETTPPAAAGAIPAEQIAPVLTGPVAANTQQNTAMPSAPPAPSVQQPMTQQPMTQQQMMQQPQPTTTQPLTQQQMNSQPTMQQPLQPAIQQPMTQQPVAPPQSTTQQQMQQVPEQQ